MKTSVNFLVVDEASLGYVLQNEFLVFGAESTSVSRNFIHSRVVETHTLQGTHDLVEIISPGAPSRSYRYGLIDP